MPIKRSRTARSCAHLENEDTGANVEIRQAEQSSSAVGARNKAARTSMSVGEVANPPVQLREMIFTVELPSPQRQPLPLQTQFTDGGVFSLHTNPRFPPALLDVCNFCKRKIGQEEDRYMNGCRGLEAYCSPACRGKFNNMMIAAGKRSPDAEPSMNHLQWNKKK